MNIVYEKIRSRCFDFKQLVHTSCFLIRIRREKRFRKLCDSLKHFNLSHSSVFFLYFNQLFVSFVSHSALSYSYVFDLSYSLGVHILQQRFGVFRVDYAHRSTADMMYVPYRKQNEYRKIQTSSARYDNIVARVSLLRVFFVAFPTDYYEKIVCSKNISHV